MTAPSAPEGLLSRTEFDLNRANWTDDYVARLFATALAYHDEHERAAELAQKLADTQEALKEAETCWTRELDLAADAEASAERAALVAAQEEIAELRQTLREVAGQVPDEYVGELLKIVERRDAKKLHRTPNDAPDCNGCWYPVEQCALPYCDCEERTSALPLPTAAKPEEAR